jgi:hypothetical protein
MASKSNKGVKLSLGEFMGSSGGTNATSSLPKGPAERAPDDDGSFKRPVRRVDNYNDHPPSRSEGDGNWRRGGPSSNGPSPGFGSNGSGGNRDNYANNRGGGGGFDSDRGNSNGVFRRDDDSGTNNWRGSGISRENSVPAASTTAERPRLQLKSRTVPPPTAVPNTTTGITSPPTATKTSVVSKPNPFGSASAVNTATTSSHPKITEKAATSDDKSENGPSPVNNDKNVETRQVESLAASEGLEVEETKVDGDTNVDRSMLKQGRKEKVKREPEVINSRAAAFGPGNNMGSNKSEVGSTSYVFIFVSRVSK